MAGGGSVGPIYEAMLEFFAEERFPVAPVEGRSMLSLAYTGKNGRWTCYAQAIEHMDAFAFYSVLSVNAPADRRQEVAEFITRANYGIVLGNFEMDLRDGEVRYRTSIGAGGTSLTAAMLGPAVYANVVTMDRYLPGLMQVIYGGAAAEHAVLLCES